MKMNTNDPIVEEIKAIRDEQSTHSENDINEIVTWAEAVQAESRRSYVRYTV